jgi:hypothetical protein
MLEVMTDHENNPISWDAIIKSHKGGIASDKKNWNYYSTDRG